MSERTDAPASNLLPPITAAERAKLAAQFDDFLDEYERGLLPVSYYDPVPKNLSPVYTFDPAEPTPWEPGSPEKVEVMRARFEVKFSLYHRDDAPYIHPHFTRTLHHANNGETYVGPRRLDPYWDEPEDDEPASAFRWDTDEMARKYLRPKSPDQTKAA